jgi:hypothetical protein
VSIKLRDLIRTEINNTLNEGGGSEPGRLEVHNTNVNDAIMFVEKEYNVNLITIVPDFKKNYLLAQKIVKGGYTKRKDMPVITQNDVRDFQKRLSSGFIDNRIPFAPKTAIDNPFPEGLTGEQAKEFLSNGLRDKNSKDDIIKVSKSKLSVGLLNPIQKQIYFDKSITFLTKRGIKSATNFLSKTIFITSSDNYIIDGHHRFLGGVLINPKLKVNLLRIHLPISTLLPLSVAYSDSIGNKRNG